MSSLGKKAIYTVKGVFRVSVDVRLTFVWVGSGGGGGTDGIEGCGGHHCV